MTGRFPTLHHGAATDPEANFLQRFIDSDFGVVTGSFLHTTGALLFTAGIVLYIYQARIVKAATKTSIVPSLKVLPIAHAANLAGIAFNGLGGLMRLYQSDHPGIDQIGTSAWVQLLFVKHIFLVAGIGLAGFLTYRTHLLAQADDAPAGFVPEANRLQGIAAASFLTILLASILGAAAGNATIPGMEDTMPDDGRGAAAASGTFFRYANLTGAVSGNPVAPGREGVTLDVPRDGFALWAELTWTLQNVRLSLEVKNPQGAEVAGKRTSAPQRITYELSEALGEGAWRFIVVGDTPVDVAYELRTRVAYGAAAGIYEQVTTIPAKASGSASTPFREIDLKMKLGESFRYSWEVVDSAQAIPFNIHLHFGSVVTRPVDGQWNRYSGEWVHNETRTDGVSLMWENPHAVPVKIHFRLVGNFTVDRAPAS